MVWKNCIPQWILNAYTKQHIRSTLFHIFGGGTSLACILLALATYYQGIWLWFWITVGVFGLFSVAISIRFVKDDNSDWGCIGKLITFACYLLIFGLLSLVMFAVIIFGFICLLNNIGIYIFNIHKKIDNVHKSYLVQKRAFWVLYRFSTGDKCHCLNLRRSNKCNIIQPILGIILSIIYFPITCISSLFWGIGQIEKDILTFPIS